MNIRSKLIHCFIAVLAIEFLAQASRATDRFYPDETAISPNGRWRVDAKSLGNVPRPQPFAENFTYTLTDTSTNNVVWTRAQPKNEDSPVSIFVHDSAWAVVRTGLDQLLFLDPRTGRSVFECSILKNAFDGDDHRYVHDTTAGPMWAGRSHWYFLEHEGRLHFVIRTWWDKRVIADILGKKRVDPIDDALAASCDAAERNHVAATLDGAFQRVQIRDERDYETVSNVLTAVHMAGRMRIKDVVPALRELQQSNYSGSSGGWWDTEHLKPGEINAFNLTTFTIRRDAHLALRKLGEKPDDLPCTAFSVVNEANTIEWYAGNPKGGPREVRINRLLEGMSPREVLDQVGAPDYVSFEHQAWEYEIDSQEPFTVRVFWKDKKTVKRWEEIRPALWKQGNVRYEEND